VKTTLLRLQPRGAFHFGLGSSGLPVVSVGSDTLFSAFCLSLRDLFGPARLASFLRVVRGAAVPPLRLSCALPYAGELLFFPRQHGEGWVSQRLFEAAVAGQPLPARSLQEGDLLVAEDEPLPPLPGGRLWAFEEVRRVRVGTNGVEPLRETLVRFAPGCGLAVLAEIAEEWREEVLAAFRALGESGIGGRRSWGAGHFELAVEPWEVREPATPTAYCTLSFYVPAARELEQGVLGPPARYWLTERSGWVGQPGGGTLRHRSLRAIGPGSVLAPVAGRPPVGRLADVTPAGFRDHEVLRAGWAFPVGVREMVP
jgi:CRISPR-associated protein Csm4